MPQNDDIYVRLGKTIRKMRETAGLNQQKLAELLGVLRPTVSQIENGERKLTAEELVKLSRIFNISIEALLDPAKGPQVTLEEETEEEKMKPQIRINVPQKNLKKFREVLLYVLNKVGSKPNIGETVIYKLLYFIDFDYYEKYEEQLIGAKYMKNTYGPTPVEFHKIVDKMIADKEIVKVADKYFSFPQTKYLPLRKADLNQLKATEKELIDDVLCRLSEMNAAQISDYSHNDVHWLTTEEGKAIEYEAVFYRTPPYSMREYGEDIQRG